MMLMTAKGIRMSNLVTLISGRVGRPVFDKTELTGLYDISLEYPRQSALSVATPKGSATGSVPAMPPDPNASTTTIQDSISKLGLKLVPSRGPIKLLIVEHIEKPDVN